MRNSFGIQTESGRSVEVEETETELRALVKDSDGKELWFIAFTSNEEEPTLWVGSPTYGEVVSPPDKKS